MNAFLKAYNSAICEEMKTGKMRGTN